MNNAEEQDLYTLLNLRRDSEITSSWFKHKSLSLWVKFPSYVHGPVQFLLPLNWIDDAFKCLQACECLRCCSLTPQSQRDIPLAVSRRCVCVLYPSPFLCPTKMQFSSKSLIIQTKSQPLIICSVWYMDNTYTFLQHM